MSLSALLKKLVVADRYHYKLFRTMKSSIVINAILGLLGATLAMGSVELGLRTISWYQTRQGQSLETQLRASSVSQPVADVGNVSLRGIVQQSAWPDIVYELKPNLLANFQGKTVITNATGQRSAQYPVEKPANTIRIAGVGDSVMFGWGVDADENYLSRTERALNATGSSEKRYEVLNFSVPGYNTAIEAAVLEHRALQFSPDVVVVHFVNNDYGVPSFLQRSPNPWALNNSFLWSFISGRLGQESSALEGADIGMSGRRTALDQYAYMVGAAGVRRAFNKIADLTRDRHIPVVIIVGRTIGDQQRLLRDVSNTYGFELMSIGPFVEKFFVARGMEDDADKRRRMITVSPQDAHPNAAGHGIYAEALCTALKKVLNLQDIEPSRC